MNYPYYIGIDPDVDKSGFAFLERETGYLYLESLTFPQIMNRLVQIKASGKTAQVVVEAGWLNKGNWHIKYHDNKGQATAKGYDVGRNHETGRKIIDVAKFFGYDVVEQRPLKKCWKGKDGKITQEELESFTGFANRSNQDARDAALLAWHAANLPIIIRRPK
jgi:hypothetical protein